MREDFDKLSVARLQFDQKLQVAFLMSSLLKSTTVLESRADDELKLEFEKIKLIDEAMKHASYNESVMKIGSSKKVIICRYCKIPRKADELLEANTTTKKRQEAPK